MSNPFFEHPILNSPYECPARHWELDEHGQPAQRIRETRRRAAKTRGREIDHGHLLGSMGANHLGAYGRWAFAEFIEDYQIQAGFAAKVESEFNKMIAKAAEPPIQKA